MENSATASHPSRKWIVLAVALVAVVAALAVLRTHAPTESSFYPKCMLYQWTGLHCPGCGGTRAMAALSHGRIWEAIRFNPLLILGGPIIFAVVLHQRRKERKDGRGAPKMIWILFLVLVVYSLARNIPSPTRSIFAPPVPAESTATPETDSAIESQED